MILFCVEIWPIGETVEAEDNSEKQHKCQLILYITAKMLFANYLGSNAHIESHPLRHALPLAPKERGRPLSNRPTPISGLHVLCRAVAP